MGPPDRRSKTQRNREMERRRPKAPLPLTHLTQRKPSIGRLESLHRLRRKRLSSSRRSTRWSSCYTSRSVVNLSHWSHPPLLFRAQMPYRRIFSVSGSRESVPCYPSRTRCFSEVRVTLCVLVVRRRNEYSQDQVYLCPQDTLAVAYDGSRSWQDNATTQNTTNVRLSAQR